VTVPFTDAQRSGDLNVVIVGWNDSTAAVQSVTDKDGNPYTLATGPTKVSGALSQSIYYARSVRAAAAGANSVTVSFSTAAVYPDIRVLEYAGADPANPVDVTAASSGSSTTSASAAATTTNPTDLIVGANIVRTSTTGAGSSFTRRMITSPDGDLAEDQMTARAGSYTASAPLSDSGPWVMQMVAFRTASAGSLPGNPGGGSGTSGGSGGTDSALITASPGSLGFGDVTVGGNSTLPIVLKNTGSSSVNISLATVTGTGFRLSGSLLPLTLTAGQNSSLSVIFAPAAIGNASGSVTVVSTASNSPTVVTLSGAGVGSHSVRLSWGASESGGVTGYNVYRGSTSGGPYSKVNSSPVTGTAYTDTGVEGSEEYFYVTTAVSSGGMESSYSNEVEVTIPGA
ncbi:MAG TPA: choice-of-anchor D domain-containing protein, partial [Terriglobia bacterium]|nr:choice-of-anchor D domain-containing protein [Terriglobia bacterium]